MDQLPQKLVERVTSYIPTDSLKNVLTLTSKFRYAAERFSGAYTEFTLNERNADRFLELYSGHRLLYLQEVIFRPNIPPLWAHDDENEEVECRESADEIREENECLTRQVWSLFTTLNLVENSGHQYAPGRYRLLSHGYPPDCKSLFDGQELKLDLSVMVGLTPKLPNLEYLGCKAGGFEWHRPYCDQEGDEEPHRHFEHDWDGQRRDARHEFAIAVAAHRIQLPSQFSNASDGFNDIVAYPEGVPNAKGTQQYQGDPDSPPSINDVIFTLERLDHLESTYCIDPSRIYATGKSNGGGFTGVLACDTEATKRIAAFAPVSGAFYLDADQNPPPCESSRQVPIMEFHGLADTTIPYAGGINTRGNANSTDVVTWVDDWARRDGLDVQANEATYLCEGSKQVTRYSWDDVVVHYRYNNLGHDWPSSFPNGDTGDDEGVLTCKEAEATEIILEWFGRWSL